MAILLFEELAPELILHIVSFLTLAPAGEPELILDLPAINSLSQTNNLLHSIVDQTLYNLCASVESLGTRAIFFTIEYQLERYLDRLVAAGVGLDVEYPDPRRCGPLHIAAALGFGDMVVKLLGMYGTEQEKISRVYARDQENWSALDYAAFNQDMEIIRLLAPIRVSSGGVANNVPFPASSTFEQYLGTALAISVFSGNRQILEYLLSEGANINFAIESHNTFFAGNTPLYIATSANNLELVQFLVASGADPNSGNPPMFNASSVGVAQALLAAGANPHAQDQEGRTALSHVVDVELFRFLLLECRLDPNHRDNNGQTPLHYICTMRGAEFAKAAIELLLQFGAKVDQVDSTGRTPVQIAKRKGSFFLDVVGILEPLVQDPTL